MDHGYIRLWATGPTHQTQWQHIQPHGADPDRLHVDDHRPMRRKKQFSGQTGITVREQAINVLRPDDRLIVACAAVVGNSSEDVMRVLGWIEEKRATLFDAELGKNIRGITATMDYAGHAVRQLAQMRTYPARRALVASGKKTGPAKRPLNMPLKELLAMWHQPEAFTVEYIARQAGLKPRATYMLFEGIPRRGLSSHE